MSVRKVKAINIIGMLSELDKVVKFCGDSQCFHPDDAMSFYSNTQDFVPLSDKNPFSAPLQSLRSAADMAECKRQGCAEIRCIGNGKARGYRQPPSDDPTGA